MTTNLRVLQKSRKPPKAGDVFSFQIHDNEFMFGRVVRTDAKFGVFDNVILVYLYRTASAKSDEVPALRKSDLLVPPIGTNRRPWTEGYFVTIKNVPLAPHDLLRTHCFARPSPINPTNIRYYDADGKEMKGRVEPCGEHGLDSFRTIDDKISQALGIPLAPDD